MMIRNHWSRLPFERNYGLLFLFYIHRIDWGVYLRLHPKSWLYNVWGCPEADVIWYDIGPFAFFTEGRD